MHDRVLAAPTTCSLDHPTWFPSDEHWPGISGSLESSARTDCIHSEWCFDKVMTDYPEKRLGRVDNPGTLHRHATSVQRHLSSACSLFRLTSHTSSVSAVRVWESSLARCSPPSAFGGVLDAVAHHLGCTKASASNPIRKRMASTRHAGALAATLTDWAHVIEPGELCQSTRVMIAGRSFRSHVPAECLKWQSGAISVPPLVRFPFMICVPEGKRSILCSPVETGSTAKPLHELKCIATRRKRTRVRGDVDDKLTSSVTKPPTPQRCARACRTTCDETTPAPGSLQYHCTRLMAKSTALPTSTY